MQVRIGPDPPDLLQAVHSRHYKVLQDHVRPACEGCTQSRIRIPLRKQLHVIEGREKPAQRSLDNRLVVDEQHQCAPTR